MRKARSNEEWRKEYMMLETMRSDYTQKGEERYNKLVKILYGFFVLSSVHVVTGYGSDVLEGLAFQGIIFYLNIICDFHDLSRLHILAGFQCESCRADA